MSLRRGRVSELLTAPWQIAFLLTIAVGCSRIVTVNTSAIQVVTERPREESGCDPQPQNWYSSSHAVVIGIDHYPKLDQGTQLLSAVTDAEKVAAALEERGFEVRRLLNDQASAANIKKALGRDIMNGATPGGRVLVYFAGHGVTARMGETEEGFLVPHDGTADGPATGISLETLARWLTRNPASHVFFAADACYSGLMLQSQLPLNRESVKTWGPGFVDSGCPPDADMQRYLDRRSVTLLVAGGKNDRALDSDSGGLLTRYLLQGLDGEADDGDGIITSEELGSYARSQVRRAARREMSSIQHPQLMQVGEGVMLFRSAGVAAEPPPRPPSDLFSHVHPGRPRIDFPLRAIYPDFHPEAERLLDRVEKAVSSGTGGDIEIRWCELAALEKRNAYMEPAKKACDLWKNYNRREAAKTTLVESEYRLLVQSLDPGRGLRDDARASAMKNFIVRFSSSDNPLVSEVRHALALLESGEGESELSMPVPRDMVKVEAGGFWFGTPKASSPRDKDEQYRHVVIDKPFLIAKLEVTQGEWRELMDTEPSFFSECGDDCPVEQVNLYEALSYCNARSSAEGLEACYVMDRCNGASPGEELRCMGAWFSGSACQGYRLPTEEEWEYAARAGTSTAVYSGPLQIRSGFDAPVLENIAWYGGNSGVDYSGLDCAEWKGRAKQSPTCGTHPVGRKRPNSYGLYDMIGNVWEWVWPVTPSQTEEESYQASPRQTTRGGSWYNDARDCRAANRFYLDGRVSYFNTGFRVARSLPTTGAGKGSE